MIWLSKVRGGERKSKQKGEGSEEMKKIDGAWHLTRDPPGLDFPARGFDV
jgi:hypothetical protein